MAAVSPNEETADGYYSKTCDAMKHKRYDEALKACERAIDAGCSDCYLAHALNIKGTFLFLKGDTEGALTCFNRSIDIDPKYVQSYIKRSSVYMEQGKQGYVLLERDGVRWLMYYYYQATYLRHSSNLRRRYP